MSGIMLNFAGVTATSVPGAPTIGTATATGSSTATVSFTAPASNGGSAILSYTAVSSPSGITGTLTQAGSGTITVSGLSPLTSYTFVVFATNAIGNSPNSSASNSITTQLPAIGDAFGGGFFAGQIGVSSTATHNIVVGPSSSADTSLRWTTITTPASGALSIINGPQNTADIVASGNSTQFPAAHFCNDLVIGGFSDWYLPARNELEICYFNLKPTTTNNQTNSGENQNAVPVRNNNYSTSNPARTSVAAFQSGGAQAFTATGYWGSNIEPYDSRYRIRSQQFNDGLFFNGYRSSTYRLRAIRRVAV